MKRDGNYKNHFKNSRPRYGIVDILKNAYRRNLLNDLYNTRRFSMPKEGDVMPKAPLGRPNSDGPHCLMREGAEHVAVYSAQEIDGAHKSKEVDINHFKLYIITRCVDERTVADQRLAESFLRITHQKQMRKDESKREKLESRQKKLSSQGVVGTGIAADASSGGDLSDPGSSSHFSESIHGSVAYHGHESSSQLREFADDPRLNDPFLR